MFGEFEHTCLLEMARELRRSGLEQADCAARIAERTGGFITPFRIAQAVHTAFHPEDCPDLI